MLCPTGTDTERGTEKGLKITKSRGLRDFVAAGVPARTFSVGIAAVWSVQHPRSLGDTDNMGPGPGPVKGQNPTPRSLQPVGVSLFFSATWFQFHRA